MDIQVQKREVFGKQVRFLRNQGLIPGELYGHKVENVHLSIPAKEFGKLYKEAGESTIVNVVLGTKKIPSLIYYVTVNTMSGELNHVDFYAVKMDEKIRTEIPLIFEGDSLAVKDGGVLIKSMKEIEVEALPNDLPAHITVNLADLKSVHDSIYVKDLKVGSKVKLFVEPETVVATVIEQAKEEVVVAPVSVEGVKVEGEEKKKEKKPPRKKKGKPVKNK